MTMLFSLVYVVPGDPASIALGPRATDEMKQELRTRMGMDQPVYVQLANFVSNAIHGNFGVDVWTNRPVADVVFEALPYTLWLVTASIGWAILLGVPLGIVSAAWRNGLVDRLVGFISVATIAIPSFIVAVYSLIFFAVRLRWFPAIGAGPEGDVLAQAKHLVLPAFAVGLGWVGYLARLVRASMLETLGENHVRTARAFGIPEWRILSHYALRVAITPTIAVIGVGIGTLISGAVLAEVVFSRPGIGKLAYDAVGARNYPVVMGAVLLTTALYALCTLLADIIIAWMDPRARSRS
jgi:peptide/nickel transport system permease protein